jgi:hypothetical protein
MGGRNFNNRYKKMKKTFRKKHKKAKPSRNMTNKYKKTHKKVHKKTRDEPNTNIDEGFKKLNCSPIVEGATRVKESCIPDDILIRIRNEYNKDHPDNKIVSTHLTEIWYELKKRLNCKTEKCWLNELDDNELQRKLKQNLFAPNEPPEWKHNPDEWLSNYDIAAVLRQYAQSNKYNYFAFIEPTTIDFDDRPIDMGGKCVDDKLCEFKLEKYIKNQKSKIAVVFNLDKHNESGSHWVSLFIDLDEKFIMYFDSAGDKIKKEFQALVDRILSQAKELDIHLEYDTTHVEHQRGNTECGMYSLYFIISLLTGETDRGVYLKRYTDKYNFFKNKNLRIPDKFVFDLRKKYFNSGGSQ